MGETEAAGQQPQADGAQSDKPEAQPATKFEPVAPEAQPATKFEPVAPEAQPATKFEPVAPEAQPATKLSWWRRMLSRPRSSRQ